MLSSWPIKKVNIYPFFNVYTKLIIKVTHSSQDLSFFFETLEYLTEIRKCHLPSPVHQFLLFIINLPTFPTYIKETLYSFHSFVQLTFILYLLCARSNRYKIPS